MALSSTSDWAKDLRSPLLVIAQARDQLHQAERLVADYITEHPELVVNSTVSETAKAAGTSDATVVRFCRSVGLKGFPELKLALARDVTRGRAGATDQSAVLASDTADRVAFVTFTAQQQSLTDTMEIQTASALDAAVTAIAEASCLVAIGDSTRASVLAESERRFSAIGMNVHSSIDVGNVGSALSRLQMGDAVLSFPGATMSAQHARFLEIAASRGAVTITVTPSIGREIDDRANVTLHVAPAGVDIGGAVLESIVAEISVLESLLVAVAIRRHDETLSALRLIERAQSIL